MNEQQCRNDLAEVCKLAYERGYICGTEGNFSIKIAPELILSTPRGVCKGRLRPDDFILTNLNGIELNKADKNKASTELDMHLTAYKVRADVKAVVHAHPTVTVAFTVAGLPLSKCVLPEVVCSLGLIPVAPYATPSTPEVSENIKDFLRDNDAVVLDHHGVIVLGNDIWDAYYKLETMEHHSQTMLIAHMLGGVKPLYASQVRKLLNIRSNYGYTKPMPTEVIANAPYCEPDKEVPA